MIEVELKARLRNKAETEARVASFATFAGTVDKVDSYWHGPDWRLMRGTKGFRLREEGGRTMVTYKTKRTEGGIEINREREFDLSDPEAFIEFLLRLGCEPFYQKRKRGSRYLIDPCAGEAVPKKPCKGSASIEIVEVLGLGDFIEIEVLLEEEDPAAVALAQGEIRGLLAQSGVSPKEIESRYYSELLMDAGIVPRL